MAKTRNRKDITEGPFRYNNSLLSHKHWFSFPSFQYHRHSLVDLLNHCIFWGMYFLFVDSPFRYLLNLTFTCFLFLLLFISIFSQLCCILPSTNLNHLYTNLSFLRSNFSPSFLYTVFCHFSDLPLFAFHLPSHASPFLFYQQSFYITFPHLCPL